MAAMESNHPTPVDGQDTMSQTAASLDELISSLSRLDPAEAAEPAREIADRLGQMLESEEDPS